MEANKTQVGGEHYKVGYQHWDMVCDTGMPYLLGCATKYLIRWKHKNGLEDLKKAIHYIRKAEERKVYMPRHNQADIDCFRAQLDPRESMTTKLIAQGDYDNAILLIETIIGYDAGGPKDGQI